MADDPMTPGQIAHETYWRTFADRPPTLPWEQLIPDNRDAWEAAAQAVLEAFVSSAQRLAPPQEEETP